MEYLLDTANLEAIKNYRDIFPITGITSNPSIVKKEGNVDFFKHMKQIRELIGMDKTFHIQVTSMDVAGMLKDAAAILKHVDDKIYIKVPVTIEGMQVIRKLKSEHINVTATAIYSKTQGFLAMEAGADFIAPYYNRMENSGIDPDDVISAFAEMIAENGYNTKILAASFKNAGQVDRAFLAGAQTATMDPSILVSALQQPSILKAVDDFSNDWKSIYGNLSIHQMK